MGTIPATADHDLLVRAMKEGAPACGIDPGRVRVLAPGAVEVTGTGVTVFWTPDACGEAPGWLVRETLKPEAPGKPPTSCVVTRVPTAEGVRAATEALLLAVQRRLDILLRGI